MIYHDVSLSKAEIGEGQPAAALLFLEIALVEHSHARLFICSLAAPELQRKP